MVVVVVDVVVGSVKALLHFRFSCCVFREREDGRRGRGGMRKIIATGPLGVEQRTQGMYVFESVALFALC